MAIEYTNVRRAGTDLLIKSKSSVSQRQADFGSAPVNLNWNARPRAVGCRRVPAAVARARHHRPEPRALMCGVAVIEQSGKGSLTGRREARYLDGGQQRLDQEHGWGLRWTSGRK